VKPGLFLALACYGWLGRWSKKTGGASTKLQARLAPHSVLMLLLTAPAKT
jgi:alpha-galactosidase